MNAADAAPFTPPCGKDAANVTPPAQSGGSFSGDTAGVYGGSLNNSVCDKSQMINYLAAHPDKAAGWASIEGITVAQAPARQHPGAVPDHPGEPDADRQHESEPDRLVEFEFAADGDAVPDAIHLPIGLPEPERHAHRLVESQPGGLGRFEQFRWFEQFERELGLQRHGVPQPLAL